MTYSAISSVQAVTTKDKVFYLQSRGVSKQEAIKILVLAFISELDFRNETISENIINEIKKVFLEEKI